MPDQSRQLAAIMFTDIVGYTRLMGEDEQKAMQVLRKYRNLHKSIIKKHNGKWLKEMGDGTLASFKTVSDAVYCAGDLIKGCEEEDIQLRIGIHEGEVIEEHGDIFGDGVNIASRLEPMAEPGQILVSGSVNRNIKNKPGISSIFLKEAELKHVDEPVKVYQLSVDLSKVDFDYHKKHSWLNNKSILSLALIALAFLMAYSLSDYIQINNVEPVAEIEKSIAVLPFKNRSNDPEKQHLADGVKDAILFHLNKIKGLRVILGTSTEKYRNTTKSMPEIARELKVSYLLSGTFRKYGDTAKLFAQLINASEEYQMWSEEYNKNWLDIFSVETEIAKTIARELEIKLSPKEQQEIESLGTTNIEAYVLFTKATIKNKKWEQQSLYASIDLLNESLRIDPEFYQAYTLLAWNYTLLGLRYGDLYSSKAKKYALPAINKSIEIKPDFSDSYLVLGAIQYLLDWDFNKAERSFKHAIELGFNQPSTTYYCFCSYTKFLMQSGRFDEALRLIDDIKKIDPSYTRLYSDLGYIHFLSGRADIATVSFKEAISYSNSFGTYTNLGWAYLHQGDFQNAVLQLEAALKTASFRPSKTMAFLADAYYHFGRPEEAQRIVDELLSRRGIESKSVPFAMAFIYSGQGNVEAAFEWLKKSFLERDYELLGLKMEPQFKPLHDDPRWQEMLDKIGFPE